MVSFSYSNPIADCLEIFPKTRPFSKTNYHSDSEDSDLGVADECPTARLVPTLTYDEAEVEVRTNFLLSICINHHNRVVSSTKLLLRVAAYEHRELSHRPSPFVRLSKYRLYICIRRHSPVRAQLQK